MLHAQQKLTHSFIFTLSIMLAVTAIEILHLKFWGMNLFFDETQYWSWAKEPSFGYYSKPPMVAWMIAATTAICDDGESCVRLSSPLLHLGAAIAIYKIAAILYNKEAAFYSTLSYITMPAVVLSSSLVSTDPSLLFFWALSILFFIKAIIDDAWLWWLLTGFAAGAGMLSKYNMLMFLPSVIIYLAFSRNNRKYLMSPKFLVAAFIAMLVFLPNILWNLQNQMVSFSHTGDNATGNGIALHPDKMLEFLGAQFGVFGPILFAVLLFIILQFARGKTTDKQRLLVWQVLPLFGLITAISLLSRAHANWAAPIYVPATILVVAWMLENNKKQLLIISLGLHIFVASLFMGFAIITKTPGIKLSGAHTDLKAGIIKDPFLRLAGWQDLGDAVTTLLQSYPDATILTEEREIHSELLYYVQPHPVSAVKWNPSGKISDHYDLTSSMEGLNGNNFMLVTMRDAIDSNIATYFDEYERVGNVEINPHGDRAVNYYMYYLKGFKGYAK
jgi:hypothetical protein